MSNETYAPKHMEQPDDHFDHCCFAGCTPMGCPGRCCANMGWHARRCELSTSRQMDDAQHDIYVAKGLRKHLAPYPIAAPKHACPRCGCMAVITKRVCFGADPHNEYRCTECRWSGRNAKSALASRVTSDKSRPARRCSCGNLVGPYGNGRCGPSGCTNVPA